LDAGWRTALHTVESLATSRREEVGVRTTEPRVRCGWLDAVPVGRTDNARCPADDPVDLIDNDYRAPGGEKLRYDEGFSAAVGERDGGGHVADQRGVSSLMGKIEASSDLGSTYPELALYQDEFLSTRRVNDVALSKVREQRVDAVRGAHELEDARGGLLGVQLLRHGMTVASARDRIPRAASRHATRPGSGYIDGCRVRGRSDIPRVDGMGHPGRPRVNAALLRRGRRW